MTILAFRPRQRQGSRANSPYRRSRREQGRCRHCPFGPWNFPAAHQPERIRQLARAGLHPQAIAIITGWGLLAIQRELTRRPT